MSIVFGFIYSTPLMFYHLGLLQCLDNFHLDTRAEVDELAYD